MHAYTALCSGAPPTRRAKNQSEKSGRYHEAMVCTHSSAHFCCPSCLGSASDNHVEAHGEQAVFGRIVLTALGVPQKEATLMLTDNLSNQCILVNVRA